MEKRLCLGLGLFSSSLGAWLSCILTAQVSIQKVPPSQLGLRTAFLAECRPWRFAVSNICQLESQPSCAPVRRGEREGEQDNF